MCVLPVDGPAVRAAATTLQLSRLHTISLCGVRLMRPGLVGLGWRLLPAFLQLSLGAGCRSAEAAAAGHSTLMHQGYPQAFHSQRFAPPPHLLRSPLRASCQGSVQSCGLACLLLLPGPGAAVQLVGVILVQLPAPGLSFDAQQALLMKGSVCSWRCGCLCTTIPLRNRTQSLHSVSSGQCGHQWLTSLHLSF